MINILLLVIGSLFAGAASASVLEGEIKKAQEAGIVVK